MVIDPNDAVALERRISDLLGEMTLTEKVGQMSQVNSADGTIPDELRESIRGGAIGSVLNEVNVDVVNELQRVAVEESRLGIPLLIGRDVIHGFRTVFPIPLGQAATFNPDVVRQGARVAAQEAASVGVNWTFAPMIDISRDPRWGRIAESLGEDPHLSGVVGAAMVEGFQGDDLARGGSIAACAKHFAGYGACESGRDYNTTNIPENELRNVHLPPFKAVLDAGVATFMASFSDLNGVPATGNEFLMKGILRNEWQFSGLVVSDWDSVRQLSVHGFTENDRAAAYEAANAGIDMEMASTTYRDNLASLIDDGRITVSQIDEMAGNILRTKIRLGLFENAHTNPANFPSIANPDNLETARLSAVQSSVLLKNKSRTLPLDRDRLSSLAIIGPLADAPYEQLGTWIFDGDPALSRTPLQAIVEAAGNAFDIHYSRAVETTRSKSTGGFAEAVEAAKAADAVVLFLGEESILSGEAHSRAVIDLPGVQAQLVREISDTGKPVVAVIMAGRPLTLANIVERVDAILYVWHPGTMGGPAIADLLFGVESPSGKLPVTFPRVVGQVPIYYAHKNTGKPATPESFVHIDDIDADAPQTSFGMTSFHLDAGYTPLFPFGYGLSYTQFEYTDIKTSADEIRTGDAVTVSAVVTNVGDFEADEVVQLYVRDLVANVTRPVKELKGFQRLRLKPGEKQTILFDLHTDNLAFYGRDMRLMTEPGDFYVWIGGSSDADLRAEFRIVSAS